MSEQKVEQKAEQKTEAPAPKKKTKVLIAVGKRKKAVAKAFIREGKGRIRINSKLLDMFEPKYVKMRIKEPVVLAGPYAEKVNIDVIVRGGGIWGQADAARTAIGNAFVIWTKDKNLKQTYIDYDRSILISDARRTEPHKPSRSTAGPRRTKQQSKR
jgi:small subunit ribosomal protein S9